MKKATVKIWTLLFILFTVCCTKDHQNISVSGHIKYNDAAHTPVKNALMSLVVSYDKKRWDNSHNDLLEMVSTDVNGYYEISTKASIPNNSFKRYELVFIDDSYGFYDNYNTLKRTYYSGIENLSVSINSGSKSITKDFVFPGSCGLKFHIKNISPANSNDLFNSIIIDNYNFPINATGQLVDSSFYFFPYNDINGKNYHYFSGRYTKNGAQQTLPVDTVLLMPLDTVNVDLFY